MKLGCVVMLAMVSVAGCGAAEVRYASKWAIARNGLQMGSVYGRDGLVYAFAVSSSTPVTRTNDIAMPPDPDGVHWCHVLADGLWFRGRKVNLPSASKVFVIKADGSVCPVEVSQAEEHLLGSENGDLDDRRLASKMKEALETE
jgi:hypothetical protein